MIKHLKIKITAQPLENESILEAAEHQKDVR